MCKDCEDSGLEREEYKVKRLFWTLYHAWREFLREGHVMKDAEYREGRMAARIIRLVHSIEKGLSIEAPRPGFGYDKIKKLSAMVQEYVRLEEPNMTCVYAACDAMEAYIAFHDAKDFQTKEYMEIKGMYERMKPYRLSAPGQQRYGGVLRIQKSDLDYDVEEIEKLFATRHSVREFSGKVPLEDVKKAIELAGRAPSACNRQAVRVYMIDSRQYLKDMKTNLAGVGGFAEDAEYFLLITGKLSAYEQEYNQFIVSAGIFAGYLSLALQTYHIASCIIQRSLRREDRWEKFCELHKIPGDEQIVCMMAIGGMKDEMTVPVSVRYEPEDIFRVL